MTASLAGLLSVLIPANFLPAQPLTTLHSFAGDNDGAGPYAGLILDGDTLYGTTQGTVFKLRADGSGFTTLHKFNGADGVNVLGGLVLAGNSLYGTAEGGGSFTYGTVFKLGTDGTGFTNLYNFDALQGAASPGAGLLLSGDILYGTADSVFCVKTDGTGFTNLHRFSALLNGTNSDGVYPYAGLVLADNLLYGTAFQGGSAGFGTVFKLNPDGTGFTTLHSFTGGCAGCGGAGAFPMAPLVVSGGVLYGTTHGDFGASGYGTVFRLNTDGTGFATLHVFTGGSDGASPVAGLFLSGDTLFGVTAGGGAWGRGSVFQLHTDGGGFVSLYSFTPTVPVYPPPPFFGTIYTNTDGAGPCGTLVAADNTLYGTAFEGGWWGQGTVFSMVIRPQLAIVRSGAGVLVQWPTNFASFTLEFATNVVAPAWVPVSAPSAVVDDLNTVTNPLSATPGFYRLSQIKPGGL